MRIIRNENETETELCTGSFPSFYSKNSFEEAVAVVHGSNEGLWYFQTRSLCITSVFKVHFVAVRVTRGLTKVQKANARACG